MTNITMSCVHCDSRYRIQPRYGAMLAKMDEMRVEEEEGLTGRRIASKARLAPVAATTTTTRESVYLICTSGHN